jgi:mRNA export factor
MDVKGKMLALATADRKLHCFDISTNPSAPFRSIDSVLKQPTRTLRIFAEGTNFVHASAEGRVSIHYFDAATDVSTKDGRKLSFAFRCHRKDGAPAPGVSKTSTV